MTREELKNILPHREEMLLLDEAFLKDGKACARYRFRGDEWFFRGHFPGNPVVPGVILCEILAQSAAVLLHDGDTTGKVTYFTGLDRVRFRTPVRPGDTVETVCSMTAERPPFYFAQGTGTVGGKVCVKAAFSFALSER
ncbi:MAG TPA: 3-hydroxyacyl-ACP dehydratase FabZ family protein [Oscillospiraceae bacterium]|nr:3-hydroxyacyl-ACP dehydratase FabZ family protein [Oscillospiraceae bacterium]